MNFTQRNRFFSFSVTLLCSLTLFLTDSLFAAAGVVDYQALAEEYKQMPVETNQISGWPQGPAVSAKSAILMDADSGAILYAKNIHEHLYPASTTKILTAYLARQYSDMDEMVEYSEEAVNSIVWWDDSNIGIRAGESITMEQSLYGLLVGSGNECANAIGEHISSSIDGFVDLMNETAAKLGCVDSHFVTTNGKHDENHYTSAYDLATIGRAFFADELLCRMSSTPDYVIPQSDTLSRELIPFTKNKLLPGKQYAYEYLVGSKTGYTDVARQNLVSCAQKDGMKLICVVMSEESPTQFTDTIDLFNYGFNSFVSLPVADYDTTYSVKGNQSFLAENPIFGDNAPILAMAADSRVIIPADASFEDLDSQLDYDSAADGQIAVVRYSYLGQFVGSAPICFQESDSSFDFNAVPVSTETTATEKEEEDAASSSRDGRVVFLNVKKILAITGVAAAVLILLLILRQAFYDRRMLKRRRAIMRRHREKKDEIVHFDKYTTPYE